MSTHFSASRPKRYLTFFWMHRRVTYKHFQNTFPQNVGSDCTFVYIDGLMQSVLYRKSKHNASQWLRRLQPYHKSKHCHIVFCLKKLVGNVGYPTILLKFTLPCYKVKLCPIKTHCWHISCIITLPSLTNTSTLLKYAVHDDSGKLFPILIQCWLIRYLTLSLANGNLITTLLYTL